MRFDALRNKFRRFLGAVMTFFGGFALLTGTLAWRRGAHMAALGIIYLLAGAVLTYSGIQALRATWRK